jgi:hypothetical protein
MMRALVLAGLVALFATPAPAAATVDAGAMVCFEAIALSCLGDCVHLAAVDVGPAGHQCHVVTLPL